jgi:hypothetical protein
LANCSNSAARSCELYRFLPIAFLPVRSLIALGLAIWGWSGAYLSPEESESRQGWYASADTHYKHWKSFLFD